MTIWLDATTSIVLAPPLIGIPRVEMSLIENLIYQQNPELRFCMYHQNNGRYYEMLRPDLIKYIDRNNSIECNYEVTADLSTPGGLAIDDDVFSPGDVYLSVGFSNRRQLSDLGRIYEIRRRIGIKVILCIHDIIPIKFTHYVPSMGETFMPYVDAIAENADHILVDSHSTRMDLLSYLREKKLRVPATSLLHLGCEIAAKKAISTPPPPVCAQPYIALISTVEKRKNHRIICDAYRILIDLGFNDLPQLIFVGQHAHGSGELLDDVKNDSRLCDKIIFLNSVSDISLLHIYQNCLFTVYPSLYEGFGLPIVESLALGKICISSNSSSMPEAGGIFADYADPYNATEWANKILSYLQNPDLLKRREEGIRLGYRAPKWSDTAEQTMKLANEVQGKDIISEQYLGFTYRKSQEIKVTLLTASSKEYWKILEHSAPNKIEYCLRHKIQLSIAVHDTNQSIWGERELFMLDALATFNCDWLWFMGADTLITNMTIDIRNFCDTRYDFIIGEDINGINNDSFLIKNTRESREFLERVLMRRDAPHDQDAMLWEMESGGLKSIVVSQKLFNAYKYDEYWFGPYPQGTWEQDDFVLHLPALDIKRRAELMSEHLGYVKR